MDIPEFTPLSGAWLEADYCLDLEGGKFFFNTVREGDSVLFATEDEQVLFNDLGAV